MQGPELSRTSSQGTRLNPSWSFKHLRDIHVVMEIYGQKDEVATEWEEQAMAPEEQTRYRAIAARLNFLAVDRPDLPYAAKECSDWEAIKRICRY